MEKIKTPNFQHEIISISESVPLLKMVFTDSINIDDIDLSSIEVITSGGGVCRTFTEYNTIYKHDGDTLILSSDGSVYVEPEQYEPIVDNITVDLDSVKRVRIQQSKTLLEKYLENHPLLYTDGNYYSVTKNKQNLLAGKLLTYQLELQSGVENPELTWNRSGDVLVPWAYENLVCLNNAIKTYVEPYVIKQQVYEKQINLSSTVEEVNDLVIDYDN